MAALPTAPMVSSGRYAGREIYDDADLVIPSLETGMIEENHLRRSQLDTSRSDPPYSAISPNKTMLKRGKTMTSLNDTGGAGVGPRKTTKRRKTTGSTGDSFSWDQQSSLNFEHQQTATYGTEVSSHFRDEDHTASPCLENEIGTTVNGDQTFENEATEGTPSIGAEVTEPDYRDQSRDDLIGRSKSVPADPPSPHDTEPISSLSIARARRTNTCTDGLQLSFDVSHSEAALPQPAQAVTPDKTPANNRSHGSFEHGQEGLKDEQVDDDYGGMPQELYKPRPSRSRSARSQLDEANHAPQKDHDTGLAVVIQQDASAEKPTPTNDDGIDSFESTLGEDTGHKPNDAPECFVESKTCSTDAITLARSQGPKIQEPPTASRKRAKQKLKRGKTTSAVLNRATDPDIEEDVIWVDEKPVMQSFNDPPAPVVQPRQTDVQLKNANEPAAATSELETEHPHTEAAAGLPNATDAPASAPKKRNRKRKPSTQSDEQMKDAKDSSVITTQPESERAHTEVVAEQPNDITAQASAPKKRGRKRKSTTQSVSEQVPAAPETTDTFGDTNNVAITSNTPDTRQPLSEQDANIALRSNFNGSTETTAPPNEEQGEDENQHQCSRPTPRDVVPTSTPQDNQSAGPASPQKPPETPQTPAKAEKGPDKHSPISVTNKSSFRVGLSRKARIAPLLKVVKK